MVLPAAEANRKRPLPRHAARSREGVQEPDPVRKPRAAQRRCLGKRRFELPSMGCRLRPRAGWFYRPAAAHSSPGPPPPRAGPPPPPRPRGPPGVLRGASFAPRGGTRFPERPLRCDRSLRQGEIRQKHGRVYLGDRRFLGARRVRQATGPAGPESGPGTSL